MFNIRADIIGAWHQGFTVQEIAEDQDIDLQTVKQIIAEHKRKMKGGHNG